MIVAQEKIGRHGFFEEALKQKKNRRRKATFKAEKLALLGFILLIFSVGVFITYYCAQMFTISYRINSLDKELALLRVENHGLESQIQQLINLEQIEYVAINELGMVKPDISNFLVVAVGDEELNVLVNQPEAQPDEDETAVGEGNLFIRAFDELVSRLDREGG